MEMSGQGRSGDVRQGEKLRCQASRPEEKRRGQAGEEMERSGQQARGEAGRSDRGRNREVRPGEKKRC